MKEKITLGFIFILIASMLLIQLNSVTAIQVVGKQQTFNMPEEENVNVGIQQGIEKFFNVEEGKSLLQQRIVVTTSQDKVKKESERLQIEAPKIDDKNPILAILLINGDKLEDSFYHYDEQTGKLEVTMGENENTSNIYKIIYGYEQVNSTEKKMIVLNTTAYVKIENKEEIQANDRQELELNQVGKNVSVEATIDKEAYKGYLYEAKENDTCYQQDNNIEISNMQNVEEVKLQTNQPEYTYYTGTQQEKRMVMPVKDHVYFQKTWISQDNMKKVLGEEGKIVIQNQKDEVIAEINKDTRNR